MDRASINGKPIGRQPGGAVISRSAILILSGVLIGTTIGHGDMPGLGFYRFCAGILGLISFVGLELVASSRRSRVLRKTLAAADSALKSRLLRHVGSQFLLGPKQRRSTARAESSYLPVTVAQGDRAGRREDPSGF